MVDLSKVYLFRMTHINNVPHIIRHGLTHKDSPNANPNYASIGDSDLITTRSSFELDNGNKLGNYIPFYFGVRMPMLFVIQNGFNSVAKLPADQIVYCVISVQGVINANLDFVFTNGHTVNTLSSQYDKSNIEQINEIIDMRAIKAKMI